MLDIVIAVALGILTLATAYLGVHVTLHPAETLKEKRSYKIGFSVCGITACVLIGIQAYRNNQGQAALQQKISQIATNTQQPPKVQVTNNIPVPSVVFQSPQAKGDLTHIAPSSNGNKFQAMTNSQLKSASFNFAKRMRAFERRMHEQMSSAADNLIIEHGVPRPPSEQEKQVYADDENLYNHTLLGDAIALRTELWNRLERLPPADMSPNSGMAAFTAQPVVLTNDSNPFEAYPLDDGAAYLEKLAKQLPK